MIQPDTVFNFPATNNITFAPGAHSTWHRHGGMVVLVTGSGGTFMPHRLRPKQQESEREIPYSVEYYPGTAYTAEYNTLKDIVKAAPDAEHSEGLNVITTKMNGEDIDKKFPQIDAWLEKVNLQ